MAGLRPSQSKPTLAKVGAYGTFGPPGVRWITSVKNVYRGASASGETCAGVSRFHWCSGDSGAQAMIALRRALAVNDDLGAILQRVSDVRLDRLDCLHLMTSCRARLEAG